MADFAEKVIAAHQAYAESGLRRDCVAVSGISFDSSPLPLALALLCLPWCLLLAIYRLSLLLPFSRLLPEHEEAEAQTLAELEGTHHLHHFEHLENGLNEAKEVFWVVAGCTKLCFVRTASKPRELSLLPLQVS